MNKLPRPFKEWTTYNDHVGIDYPYKDDTLVKASGNGVVTFAGYFSSKGGYGVSVQYDNGQLQSYKHSDKNDWRIKSGTRVSLGTNLMEIGGTGEGSTGPHLHHEVFINGVIQTGDNYWKYVDKASNGYVGAPSSSGGNETPITQKEIEEVLYILNILETAGPKKTVAVVPQGQKMPRAVTLYGSLTDPSTKTIPVFTVRDPKEFANWQKAVEGL